MQETGVLCSSIQLDILSKSWQTWFRLSMGSETPPWLYAGCPVVPSQGRRKDLLLLLLFGVSSVHDSQGNPATISSSSPWVHLFNTIPTLSSEMHFFMIVLKGSSPLVLWLGLESTSLPTANSRSIKRSAYMFMESVFVWCSLKDALLWSSSLSFPAYIGFR